MGEKILPETMRVYRHCSKRSIVYRRRRHVHRRNDEPPPPATAGCVFWTRNNRGYATACVGVSFASVCSHWLISIEHPTSTMEAVHLLLHACTEAISVLLWVSVR